MDNISEEANTSEMRPEQILDGIAFIIKDSKEYNPFMVNLETDNILLYLY